MQIMPFTGSELREELDLCGPELPVENIRAGIYYFSKLYSLFPGAGQGDVSGAADDAFGGTDDEGKGVLRDGVVPKSGVTPHIDIGFFSELS